jgi:hypothetical protein
MMICLWVKRFVISRAFYILGLRQTGSDSFNKSCLHAVYNMYIYQVITVASDSSRLRKGRNLMVIVASFKKHSEINVQRHETRKRPIEKIVISDMNLGF